MKYYQLIVHPCWFFLLIFSGLSLAGESRKGNIDWGVYQIYWHQKPYSIHLNNQLRSLGGNPKYVMFFRDLVRPFPLETVRSNESRGLVTIISLELTIWSRGGGSKIKFLDRILSGEFDSQFGRWAHEAARYKKKIILRFGFEMNGSWFSWGGKPQKFIKAWRHVHKLFVNQKAENVQWMFSPNVLWGDKTFAKDIFPYYPGDNFVDLTGLDGYNFGDNKSSHHKWESYTNVFEVSVKAMQKFPQPLFIAEVGCADDKRKPEWIMDFLTRISVDNRVHAFIWFNYDKRSEGESNWRLDSDPQSLKTFKKWSKINN